MPLIDENRAKVAAPPAQPPRYSLLIAAAAAGLSDDALYHGFEFYPELCGAARGGIVSLTDDGNTDAMTLPGELNKIVGDSFAVYVSDRASALELLSRDWIARLERALAASESYWLARALAIGPDANGNDGTETIANRTLNTTDSVTDEVTTSAVQATVALAAVEEALGEAQRGQRGMIHVTEDVFTILVADGSIFRDGQLWVTGMGNVVVCDAGYTGAGPGDAETPDAGTSWMFGTSMIRVQLGAISKPVPSLEAAKQRASVMKRSTNDVELYASRLATWVWDECTHIAAQVDVDAMYGAGSSGGGGDATAANQATIIGLINPTIVVEAVVADETIAAANYLWGYSLKETSGSDPAVVSIHNGDDSGDPVIGFINLAASESVPPTMFPVRIPCPDGIRFEVVSGAVSGAVYYEA